MRIKKDNQTNINSLFRTLALGSAMAALNMLAAVAFSQQSVELIEGGATGSDGGSQPLAASTTVHIALALRLRDEPGLDTFIQQSHTKGHPLYHTTLASAEVAARYAPTQAQVSMVTTFLKNNGFANIQAAGNNLFIEADAPASVVSDVFSTILVSRTLADGTKAHANTVVETIPSEISGVVHSILGLDTTTRMHTHSIRAAIQPASSSAAASNISGSLTGHIPTAFPAIYNVGNTPTASNVTVGIIAEGNMNQTLLDLATFEKNNSVTAVPTSVIYAGALSADVSNIVEWDLDSQTIVGMSGGVKQLNFYVASSMNWSDLVIAMNRAVSDNTAKVINMSIGGCESSAPLYSFDTILKVAVSQGQTFAISTGDYGSTNENRSKFGCSYAPSVESPASSPYAVAVGGTSLYTDGYGGYVTETAWGTSGECTNGECTGGGISAYEARPNWQMSVPLLGGQQFRGLPDIAFDADPNSGALIIVNGAPQPWGGTSLAAPLFAATWARILSGSQQHVFAAPGLYAMASADPGVVQDITAGSNGTYSAEPGWDLVTGWGTPKIQNLFDSDVNVVTLTPGPLQYGNQYLFEGGAPQTVTITNDTPLAVSLGAIKVTGTNPSSFKMTLTDCPGTPATLPVGGSCTMSWTFIPTAKGANSASLSLTASGAQSVILTGTGIAAPYTLSPNSLDFGEVNVGTTSPPQTVTVTNTGSSSLPIASIVSSHYFQQTNNCGQSIAVGHSCTISVTFNPGMHPVAFQQTMSVTSVSSAFGNGVQIVALTGTGGGA